MVVSWVTMNDTLTPSYVEYGPDSLSMVAKSSGPLKFVDGGPEKRVIYIHRVTMTHLKPGIKYCELTFQGLPCHRQSVVPPLWLIYVKHIVIFASFFSSVYHVGGPQGWSDILFFRSMRTDPKWAPQLALYGDMGNENAVAMASLQELAQSGSIDAILHVGKNSLDHTASWRDLEPAKSEIIMSVILCVL